MFDDHYDHVYESLSRNENYILNMSDFSLHTDHEIEAQRQDLGNYQQKEEQLPNHRCGSRRGWKGEGKGG